MKKFIFRFLGLVILVSFFQSCEKNFVENTPSEDLQLKSANLSKVSYIVVLNDADLNLELSQLKGYEKRQAAMQTATSNILKRAGITDGEVEYLYGTVLHGFAVMIPPGQLQNLQDDPSVKYVEKDQIAKLVGVQSKSNGGTVVAESQTMPWGITRVNGGVHYSGPNVAWIIDTGVDLTHPDLNVDASRGASFVRRITSPNDDNGHGSHVAGTIAAIDNGYGVIGVAAGATVIPVKVLNRNGSGTYSGVIAGIDFVGANGTPGDVANMSLGGGYSQSLNDAVINASNEGIRFALAAGNESTDAGTKSPASANGPNIFTVSAMDSNDDWAYFSNYDNPPVDYCEPGVSVYSCYKNGGYATMSGTSMATPHMAGILLLTGNNQISTDGTVIGDPDGHPDPIAVVGTISTDTGTLSGSVTDGSLAIGGATVQIAGKSTTTAPNGSYSISNIPVGTYTATASANGYSETTANVSITKNTTTTQDFTLNEIPTYTVSGTVTDTGNNPISGALVTIEGTSLSANTLSDGSYSISGVVSGTYNITASANGFDSQTQNVNVNGNLSNLNFSLQLTPVGNIVLSGVITGNKVKKTTLSWTGASGTTVEIWKDNNLLSTVTNSGSFNENLGKITTGTFTYYIVDELGIKSNSVVLSVN